MIKKIFFVFALAFALLLVCPLQNADALYEKYYFENFNVNVIVNENYTFRVTETIDAVFTEESHGIYRYLPNYWEEDRIKYTDISVEGAPYVVSKDRYETSIRIGNPSMTITGPITYNISYTVNLPKDSYSELDSVYINAIGFDHPTHTNNSEITITLPKKVDPSSISVITGYYYGYGTEDKVSYEYKDRQALRITLNEPLDYYEGITVKINLPDGYFTNIKDPFFIEEMLKYILPLALLTIALIMWKIYGDDEKLVIPVEVSPPDVSPLEAGYIIDGKINHEDISSMIIYWASLGFISIAQDNKRKNEYYFTKIKDLDDRPEYEKNIFKNIFYNNETKPISTHTLKSRLSSRIYSFNSGVKAKYSKADTRLIDKKSSIFSRINTALAYLCFSLIAFFIGLYKYTSLGVMLGLFSLIAFIPLHVILKNILQYLNKRPPLNSIFRFIVFGAVTAGYVYIFTLLSHPWVLDTYQIILMLLSSCLILAVSFHTQKLSDYGHETFERVLGFRHFLATAEKEWMEELAEDNPEYFYDMLPYALVLGVSDIWIGKFSQLITSPPEWYSSDAAATFSTRTFSSRTVSNFKRIGVQSVKMSRTPRTYSGSYSGRSSSSSYRPSTTYRPRTSSSSFSSSSGRSGGGFGGGGSRSW